jgi:predicted dehydrogenase
MQVRTDYYSLDECFEVTGETGIVKVTRATGRMLDEPVLTLYRDGEVRAFHNLDDDWGDSFAAATRAMIAAIREGGHAPLSAEEGRDVLQLALAISRSAQSGQPVALDAHPRSAGVA